MKLSIEQLQEMAELQKRTSELYKLDAFAGVSHSYVHLTEDSFVQTFPTYVAIKRNVTDGDTHKLQTVVDGALFIAITSNEDYIKGHDVHAS